MSNQIRSYDGGITASPRQLVRPTTVAVIQAIFKDIHQYPSPVRAMGSYHSLTPCASSDGTVIDMKCMTRVIEINEDALTFRAEVGLQILDAAHALRERNLRFHTSIEIGNMTLGSAATCHTKDALDGREFGQVSSYISRIKYVTPAGELAEASDENPELMSRVRSSYGLCRVVYEVTFKVAPVDELTEDEVEGIIASAQNLTCSTVGGRCVFQKRELTPRPAGLLGPLLAARRRLWNHDGDRLGHFIDTFAPEDDLRNLAHEQWAAGLNALYAALVEGGGFPCLIQTTLSTIARRGMRRVMPSRSGRLEARSG